MLQENKKHLNGHWVLLVLVVFLWTCSQSESSCSAPLPEPVEYNARVYDGVQLRITPTAFSFIQEQLPGIIESFLQGALTFQIPQTTLQLCDPVFGWVCVDVVICAEGCAISAQLVDASLEREPPYTLLLNAHVALQGSIVLSSPIPCAVQLDLQQHPIEAQLFLLIDWLDHFLYLDVPQISFQINNDEYTLCSDWPDWLQWLPALLQPIITDLINSQITDQLTPMIAEQLNAQTCLPCDFYLSGCPNPSTCDQSICRNTDQSCRRKPLGLAAQITPGQSLGQDLLGLEGSLGVLAALGQEQSSIDDPLIVLDGLELRLIGGGDNPKNSCVPAPAAEEIPSHTTPPRMPFTDQTPDTAQPFMAGVAISDGFLDWMLYQTYLSGILCLTVGGEQLELVSSDTLALILGSIRDLTDDCSSPLMIRITPTRVPHVDLGAGTFTTDADGNRIIEQPLLFVYLPGLSLDFYVSVNGRYVRMARFVMDITLQLAVDFTADGKLVPVLDQESIRVDQIQAFDYELLAEDPSTLASLIPMLVNMIVPMLGQSIQPIELPEVQGFSLRLLGIHGELPRPGTELREFLTLYADLALAAQPVLQPRQTMAEVLEVHTDHNHASPSAIGKNLRTLTLRVVANGSEPAEYSYRVDKDFWRPFQKGPRLTVRDSLLNLNGRHVIEVRARTVGDYRTLDPTPAVIQLDLSDQAPIP